jgi:hypothetical protein
MPDVPSPSPTPSSPPAHAGGGGGGGSSKAPPPKSAQSPKQPAPPQVPLKDCTQEASDAVGPLYTPRSGLTVLVSAIATTVRGGNPLPGAATSATANILTYAFFYDTTLSGCLSGQGVPLPTGP